MDVETMLKKLSEARALAQEVRHSLEIRWSEEQSRHTSTSTMLAFEKARAAVLALDAAKANVETMATLAVMKPGERPGPELLAKRFPIRKTRGK